MTMMATTIMSSISVKPAWPRLRPYPPEKQWVCMSSYVIVATRPITGQGSSRPDFAHFSLHARVANVRWLLVFTLLAGCKKSQPQPAAEQPAEATPKPPPAEQPSEEPSAEKTPLYDAAPPPPQEAEARKMVAPTYDIVRNCFKEQPAAEDEKPPYAVRMTVMTNGTISQVVVDGRPSATECVGAAIKQKLRLRPWTGNAMEIRLPVSPTGDPVYVDAGSAAR
jgi:hypothetical protein